MSIESASDRILAATESRATTCWGRPQGDRLAGHPPHDTGGFVLRDCLAAGVQHFLEPFRAVLAHSGENHADGVASRILGNRAKQDVHRGFVPIDGDAVVSRST